MEARRLLAAVIVAVALIATRGGADPCTEWEAAVQEAMDDFGQDVVNEGGRDSDEGRRILRETMYEDGSITVDGEGHTKPPNCDP